MWPTTVTLWGRGGSEQAGVLQRPSPPMHSRHFRGGHWHTHATRAAGSDAAGRLPHDDGGFRWRIRYVEPRRPLLQQPHVAHPVVIAHKGFGKAGGRTETRLEQWWGPGNDASLRPALVLGRGVRFDISEHALPAVRRHIVLQPNYSHRRFHR